MPEPPPPTGVQPGARLTTPRRRVALARYGLEFLSVFLAVGFAFALDNYAAYRRDRVAEYRIVADIRRGLQKDLLDLRENMMGHETALVSCAYFRRLALGEPVAPDSFQFHRRNLLRDYLNAQNTAGYVNLKSRGLEIIRDDSLRNSIVALYEYDYELVRKLEEQYAEGQFFLTYGDRLHDLFVDRVGFDSAGATATLEMPVTFTPRERHTLLFMVNDIAGNRRFTLRVYDGLLGNVQRVVALTESYRERR